MSSRSNGVMYWVLSSWMRSCVIESPTLSAAFTSPWPTDEFGYSRNRRSASCATSSAFAPARAKRP